MDSQYLEEFLEALESWTDERFICREDLRSLAMFFVYIVNLSEAAGWSYDGHSLKIGTPMSTLTVRATIEGAPYVVFTSGRTATGCVRMFIRKLEADLLEWRPDRYR